MSKNVYQLVNLIISYFDNDPYSTFTASLENQINYFKSIDIVN